MATEAAPRHVAVIGAGIVGVATAIRLRGEGVAVTLIDRSGPGAGASFGNGGVLASCAVVPVTTPGLIAKAPRMLLDPDQPLFLRWSYLPRLAPWLARYLRHCDAAQVRRISRALAGLIGDSLADHQALSAGTPAARYVVESDYLYLYRDRRAFEADAFAWGLRRDAGFAWEELEDAAPRAYDPAFAPDLRFAARMGGHGRISDPGAYVRALADHATALGARLVRAEVTDVARDGDRLTGLRLVADGREETLRCDAAVLAAGAWSKRLARAMGVDAPLESERGYHLDLWKPSIRLRAPVMIAAGKFVATPMEGRMRLAGVVEFGGLEAPPSRAPFDLLLRQAVRAFPGLAWAEAREWMGHRPAPADSIPLIGPAPLKGAWMGFGHHHVGLTGGPRTGLWLARMIAGRAPNIDLAPFAPARFQSRAQIARKRRQGSMT
jgi:D-amino-acid dehydrogenase